MGHLKCLFYVNFCSLWGKNVIFQCLVLLPTNFKNWPEKNLELPRCWEIIYMIIIDDSIWHEIDLGPLLANFQLETFENALYYSKQNVPAAHKNGFKMLVSVSAQIKTDKLVLQPAWKAWGCESCLTSLP